MRERDTQTAEEVIADDSRVDALDQAVQEQTVKLLALRQPMANDLRRTMASMKVANNLERCGDLAKNIAKRTLVIIESEPLTPLTRSIERMGKLVLTRLTSVLDAYTRSDSLTQGSQTGDSLLRPPGCPEIMI